MSFDPQQVTYAELIDFFFKIHDPTTLNRQGKDTGTNYRSAIFTHSAEQQKTAEEIKDRLQKTWYKDAITTVIEPVDTFWDAEDYHQLYLTHNPDGYHCPLHFLRTKPQI